MTEGIVMHKNHEDDYVSCPTCGDCLTCRPHDECPQCLGCGEPHGTFECVDADDEVPHD